MKKRKEALE